jgi:hypothetical protein
MLAVLGLALAVPPAGAADAGIPSGACDPIDPAVCLQPWPNDYFTVADASTPTGRRLDLDPLSMPRNRAGKPIDLTDMNQADGFSPGNPIVTRVPGLDNPEAFRRTGAVPITDMARYADRDHPIRQENGQTVGTDVPPTTNTPPSNGQDPHELPRRTPADRAMKSAFLTVGGRVIDTCGGAPCHSVTS